MQVKSIAECSILQYFWPSLSYHLWLRFLFCLLLVAVLHNFTVMVIELSNLLILCNCTLSYRKYRQAGDYVLKDEEDDGPVNKATSLEVKAHYGMQPVHASPLDGHSTGT